MLLSGLPGLGEVTHVINGNQYTGFKDNDLRHEGIVIAQDIPHRSV